jgi:membrane protein YqaA with SNARE-associated domain
MTKNSDNHESIATPADEKLQPLKIRHWIRRHWVSLISILVVIILSVAIYFTGALGGDFEAYGYLGVFIIAILGASVLIVPVPHLPVIFLLGSVLNPWLVGLMAGLGEPIGEIPAYTAGISGRAAIQNNKRFVKLNDLMKRRGTLVLFLFSAIPNFFFDLVGAAAGALRYPFWKYMVVVFIGKTLKGWLVAFAGYWLLGLLWEHIINSIINSML